MAENEEFLCEIESVADLNPNKTSWFIFVKVLRKWRPPINCLGQMTEMILCDETGKRIDATIPPISYMFDFERDIVEGEWYLMSNFRVINPPKFPRNSNHRYQIKCLYETNMNHVDPRSESHFFDFLSFTYINANRINDSFVHDAFGVVWTVSAIKRIPWVATENAIQDDCPLVEIEFKDSTGEIVKCCAVGEYCDRFMHSWRNKGYDEEFNFQLGNMPVVCVLRHWRVSTYEGEPCLISGFRCSSIFMDHDFDEIDIENLLTGFLADVIVDNGPNDVEDN
ncbi:uncharacterized protein LOC111830506 [Capsella rubella]|uniref:uncharacterized protein LOC111830506 n=1 Tax=Capsella rubella TaxID=81985 RepID=UPI000CD51594|nr:uncharacterized protein LOC111830506 [Capsella rubella]